MPLAPLEKKRLRLSPLDMRFHLRDLIGSGHLKTLQTPAGIIVRVAKDWTRVLILNWSYMLIDNVTVTAYLILSTLCPRMHTQAHILWDYRMPEFQSNFDKPGWFVELRGKRPGNILKMSHPRKNWWCNPLLCCLLAMIVICLFSFSETRKTATKHLGRGVGWCSPAV